MKIKRRVEEIIDQVPRKRWKSELEKTSEKYHRIAAWAAIIFDPVFGITDYLNIATGWEILITIRFIVSFISLGVLYLQPRLGYPSYTIVVVPFVLISLQNAHTYLYIDNDALLGHNLNYMALFIGAALFLAWESFYSIGAIIISIAATALFIQLNADLSATKFFVNGGLLLLVVMAFMYALIKTRYVLTGREIKTRIALEMINEEIAEQNIEIQLQNEEIQAQAEKINGINNNLERLVKERTEDLERKNQALEEAAFINAHKLRSPVASILGLVNIVQHVTLDEEGKTIIAHLTKSTRELDNIVGSITKTLERVDNVERHH